jgi:hypothetical protein
VVPPVSISLGLAVFNNMRFYRGKLYRERIKVIEIISGVDEADKSVHPARSIWTDSSRYYCARMI